MLRRDFISFLVGALVAGSRAIAQTQSKVYRVGTLLPGPPVDGMMPAIAATTCWITGMTWMVIAVRSEAIEAVWTPPTSTPIAVLGVGVGLTWSWTCRKIRPLAKA